MNTLKHLLDKNVSWASNLKEQDPTFFSRLANQQTPQYLWIGCSDSRIPATQIVDLAPGEMFVQRNIANQVIHADLNCMSVIQYSVEVLKVKHIIVCGHYGCGGINAALDNTPLGAIDGWLEHIKVIGQKHHEKLQKLDDGKKSDLLCELNVVEQVRSVCNTSFVKEAWDCGAELSVHGFIYNLENGLLKSLINDIDSSEAVDGMTPAETIR